MKDKFITSKVVAMKIYQDILHYVKSGDGQYSILMRAYDSPYTQSEICRAYDALISQDSLLFDGEKLILSKKGESLLCSLRACSG